MFRFAVFLSLVAAASAFMAPMARGPRTHSVRVNEDFGLFGFEKEWENQAVMSETKLEDALNKQGLRFRMNRMKTENEGLMDLPEIKLGPIKITPPRVGSIWEALGFTATGDNDESKKAKQEWKASLKNNTYKFARFSKEEKEEWRSKYGYDRALGEQ